MARGGLPVTYAFPWLSTPNRRGAKRGVGQVSGVDEVAAGDAFRYRHYCDYSVAGLGVIGRSQRSAHA